MTRVKSLKVQNTQGKLIQAEIVHQGDRIRITTEPIPETIADGTNNTPDGRLDVVVTASGYAEAILKMEAYLEALMLKRLSDEDRDSSVKRSANTGRPTAKTITRSDEETSGKDSAFVDSGRDGKESAPRPKRRKKPPVELVEESNPSPQESGESGDESVREPREGNE